MKKLITLLLLILSIHLYAQNHIGDNKETILKTYSNIDSLEDGTIFIKSFVEKREYYYFFNDENICYSMMINFYDIDGLNRYVKFLNKNYKRKKTLWFNKERNIFIRKKDMGLEYSIIFIWSSFIKMPDDCKYQYD